MNLSITEKNKAIYDLVFIRYKMAVAELIRAESEFSACKTAEEMEKRYDTYGMGNKFMTIPKSETAKKIVASKQNEVDKWMQILNHTAHVFIDNNSPIADVGKQYKEMSKWLL